MKNITKAVFLSAILLSMVFSQAAYARGRGMGKGNGPGDGEGRLMRLADKLELTTPQQEEMQQLFAEHKKEMEPLRTKMEKIKSDIDQLWQQTPVNEKALMDAIEKSGRIKTKMRKLRAEFHLDVFSILSPTQQEEFRAHQKEQRQRRMGRKFQHKGHGKRHGAKEGY